MSDHLSFRSEQIDLKRAVQKGNGSPKRPGRSVRQCEKALSVRLLWFCIKPYMYHNFDGWFVTSLTLVKNIQINYCTEKDSMDFRSKK